MRQTNREELLDLKHGTPDEARRSLHDLRRINAYLGGLQVASQGVFGLLQGRQSTVVLDVGTGSGDVPRHLEREAQKRGIALQIVAFDLQELHLKTARDQLPGSRVALVCGDAFRLPFADASVDVVLSSLFLHHFRPEQIVQLLREFERVSRVGWFMNDLVRARVPLAFFRLMWPVFARSYITRHDAQASIRRAYTPTEMRAIAAQTEIPSVQVRAHFPYRLSLTRRKP